MLDSKPNPRLFHRAMASSLTLNDLLEPRVEMHGPASPSMIFTADGEHPTAVLTRSELRRRALGVAIRLLPAASRDARALLAFPTGPEFFPAFFGCVYAGIIPAVVQAPRNSEALRRMEGIAREWGASLVLTCQAIADRVDVLEPGFWRRTALQPVIVDGSEPVSGASEPPYRPDPYGLAYLQFTSGST